MPAAMPRGPISLSRIVAHCSSPRGPTNARTLSHTLGAATTPSNSTAKGSPTAPSTVRPTKPTISDSTRSAILQHCLDGSERWDPTALAQRYKISASHVNAIRRLHLIERSVAAARGIPDDAREADEIWSRLASSAPRAQPEGASDATGAGVLEVQGEAVSARGGGGKPRFWVGPRDAEGAREQDARDEEETQGVRSVEGERELTETAKWVEEELPVREPVLKPRRSAFIFMEIGEGIADDQRAVFVRDGDGVLRKPTEAEREQMLASRRTGKPRTA